MLSRLPSPQQPRLSGSSAGVLEWENTRLCSCFSTERRWLCFKETPFPFAFPFASPGCFSCLPAGSPKLPPGPRRSAGRGEADAVVAPVEFGVVVPDEAGAQDPEGASRRGDVQPRESHHADVLPVLGLLQGGAEPVPEVPGGGFLAQRASPSPTPCSWPSIPFLHEGISLPVSTPCSSPQISPSHPPRKQLNVSVWGKTGSIPLGLAGESREGAARHWMLPEAHELRLSPRDGPIPALPPPRRDAAHPQDVG